MSLAAVLILAATPVAADTAAGATPRVEGAHPATATGEPAEAATARPRATGTPLTRAAVRARIAGIDPGSWLARFGAVDRRPAGEH